MRLIVYKQWIKASRRFESRKMVKLDVIQTSVISALTPYFSQIYKWNTRSFHLEGCLTTSFNLCTIVSKWLAFVFDTMRVLLEISRFCFVSARTKKQITFIKNYQPKYLRQKRMDSYFNILQLTGLLRLDSNSNFTKLHYLFIVQREKIENGPMGLGKVSYHLSQDRRIVLRPYS